MADSEWRLRSICRSKRLRKSPLWQRHEERIRIREADPAEGLERLRAVLEERGKHEIAICEDEREKRGQRRYMEKYGDGANRLGNLGPAMPWATPFGIAGQINEAPGHLVGHSGRWRKAARRSKRTCLVAGRAFSQRSDRRHGCGSKQDQYDGWHLTIHEPIARRGSVIRTGAPTSEPVHSPGGTPST